MVFAAFLVGCDCAYEVSGIVLDEDTRMPIPEVFVARDSVFKRDLVVSDSAGRFDFSDVDGGWTCPELRLYYGKQGYVLFEKYYPDHIVRSDTIYLKRE